MGNTRPPQTIPDFNGDATERAYLTYFVTGDMHSYRHGRKIRVEGGTTHPAQLELMCGLFGGYAKPIFSPFLTPDGHHAIRATFDLASSFGFLLRKPKRLERPMLREDPLFFSALAGFSDAEGHVGLRRNGGRAYARYSLSNRNRQLMEGFLQGLDSRGYHARLYALHGQKVQWQLEASGQHALELLPRIAFRHSEKIAAVTIALAHNASPWRLSGPRYAAHRRRIKTDRMRLEVIAARQFGLRTERALKKKEIFRQKVESTFDLFAKGLTVHDVAKELNCSVRTAYRRKAQFSAKATIGPRHRSV